MKARLPLYATALLFISLLLGACSIKQLAVDTVIDALSEGGGTTFTGDNDPELVGDALPFALKLYETLLAQSPDNRGLLRTTGSGFIMYSNVYVQMPADMLPASRHEERSEMRQRAKKLYIRGRDYVIDALDVGHPGFAEALENDDYQGYLREMTEEDVPDLYWAGSGWLGAIAINAFDVKLGITREKAIALIQRALEIDESYGDGAIHGVLISYYGSLPAMLGGSEEKAREHFQRALELSEGQNAGAYVSLAQSVSVGNQDHEEFRMLLNKALEITPTNPENRLETIIMQEKAQWLLDNIDDYFLLD